MAEYRFDDSAYLGQSPGNTTHESLAYLGSFDSGDGGVCVECDDEAYFGLAPGRTTASRAAYIGLYEPSVVVEPVPTVAPTPTSAWSSQEMWMPYRRTQVAEAKEVQLPETSDDEDAILAILMYSIAAY